ncbi:hypothetical protein M8494_27695 [Serratia ureilytica]
MLGLDALVLFRQRRLALFFLFAMLLGAALQITNTFGPVPCDLSLNPLYPGQPRRPVSGGAAVAVADLRSILLSSPFLLPSPLRHQAGDADQHGGLDAALPVLAYGTPVGFGFVLLLLSMIVYGCAFDFLISPAPSSSRKEADRRIRASAQGCS